MAQAAPQPVKEHLTTLDDDGHRVWLYPDWVDGVWRRRRGLVNGLLIALYLFLPWMTVGGRQAVLLDLPHRKLFLFGAVLWPQDSILLWLTILSGILGVFLFTALFGRIWCGWACPQTVFMEGVFRRIEDAIEGRPNVRRKRDRGPWNLDKVWRKALKHGLFLAISVHVANTALCYFAGTDQVVDMTLTRPGEHLGWFGFMSTVSILFYLDFAWFREQLCTVACPYGRWQSVLLDRHSVIVGYDPNRGEPRGMKRDRRKNPETDYGDCIDCNRCVQVCPTGIDIRMGLQLECVNCTACIDACDDVMARVDKPLGLIRYTSLAELDGEVPTLSKTRWLRTRTVLYGIAWLAALTALVVGVTGRSSVEVQVLRARDGVATSASDGVATNHLRARVVNKGEKPLSVRVESVEGYDLVIPRKPWPVGGGEIAALEIFVRVPVERLDSEGHAPVTLRFFDGDNQLDEERTTFLGPLQGVEPPPTRGEQP